jgi:hypothetical protein
MRLYPRGAEWRKWDLHVHAPGSKLGDGYGAPAPWDQYCEIIETSDVAVIGVTDYFSLDAYFDLLAEHKSRYPDSEKVFFANLELRLNETVNTAQELVHVHLLFRPGVDGEAISGLLARLPVQETEATGRSRNCAELKTQQDYASATVTREGIAEAIRAVFGDEVHAAEHVLVLVPANNDGIRAGDSQRKRQIADEIEKGADALFGTAPNREYFLRVDRYESADVVAVAKPVFGGSDAHSIEQLKDWLGKAVETPGQSKSVTWVKADPTFEGLQQTLVEPAERVRIQPTIPDAKEPYKIISSIGFTGTEEFPAEIQLNQNLVSVIGSRSSGKSALLAYVAHAVDPDATLRQQQAVQPLLKAEKLGPAAGITWDDVKDIGCTVHWEASSEHTGQVIYIPQNSLHAISERPSEITAKIESTVSRLDPGFQLAHETALLEIEAANDAIGDAVRRWFELTREAENATVKLRDLGDREAVTQTQLDLQEKIDALRAASSLGEKELAQYQQLTDRLGAIEGQLRVIGTDLRALAPFLAGGEDASDAYRLGPAFRLSITATPDPGGLPEDLESGVRSLIEDARRDLTGKIEADILARRASLAKEHEELEAEDQKLREDNAELIAKNAANAEIDTLMKSKQKQDQALAEIDRRTKAIEALGDARSEQVAVIVAEIERRTRALSTVKQAFDAREHVLERMRFGLEQQLDGQTLWRLAERFNQHERGPFIARETKHVEVTKAHVDPDALLRALHDGTQKAMKGEDPEQLAADVLTATPEHRFYAELEGDRIGGFQDSSMTPGKQALFALTLILNESDDAWPLLIDQPEDDLDSRSVYDVLVGYLIERKKERQIIMVSHNANLVIGADSEQILVANRHGDDRQNPQARQFAYRGGSLEHSEAKKGSGPVLESCGIREHACELLDGGEEAFRKRRAKYKL